MARQDSPDDNRRSASRRWWTALAEAIRGSEQDFTSGKLGRAIVLLAVPMVLEMLMQSVFELADIYFVSRLGAESVAAVGITASLLIFVFATGIGLSMAITAMVARRIGEKDPIAASAAAFQAIVVAVAVSVPFAVLGIAFAPDLLRMMGATEAVVGMGTLYAAILFGSNVTILLLFLINAIFRGAGDAALAMRSLALANVLNIILDPILIFGLGPIPEMGITGAAVATVFSRTVGVTFQLTVLIRGTGRLRMGREAMRLNVEVVRRMLLISGPGVIQYLVGSATWILIIRLVAEFGSEAVAGYTIGVRIIIFGLLPSWGMGNAAATLVGQNLGARLPDRAERAVWITAGYNTVFLTLVGVGLLCWDRELLRLFSSEPTVIAVGAELLRYVAYSYPFFALGTVMVQAFNGAGDTVTPTWINFVCYWLFQIPLALVLAHPVGLGVEGIFIAIAIAQTAFALVGILLFRRGLWKHKVV
ncbi:MAG: MATE family efflux transporter [Rhodothermales bacterium]